MPLRGEDVAAVSVGGGGEMRNRHPGNCYRCGKTVRKGEGHAERKDGAWAVQHVECCKLARKLKEVIK
jgi:hypothetical protein